MKYQFEVDEEITRCYDCPLLFEVCETNQENHVSYVDYVCRIKLKKSERIETKPDWCPLVKVADHTPILEKLKVELSELESLQNNETDQECYETRRDAINYIKGKITAYEYNMGVQ